MRIPIIFISECPICRAAPLMFIIMIRDSYIAGGPIYRPWRQRVQHKGNRTPLIVAYMMSETSNALNECTG